MDTQDLCIACFEPENRENMKLALIPEFIKRKRTGKYIKGFVCSYCYENYEELVKIEPDNKSDFNLNFPQGYKIILFPMSLQKKGEITILVHPDDMPKKNKSCH